MLSRLGRWLTIIIVALVIVVSGNLAADQREFVQRRLNTGDVEQWLPAVLYLSGIGLLFAALIMAAAEIVAKAHLDSTARDAVSTHTIGDVNKLIELLTGLANAAKGLFGAIPSWAIMGVAAIVLIGLGSLYDGYTVFGLEIEAPATGDAAQATQESIRLQATVAAAEAQATLTALANLPAATPTP